ncbi:hypothetical protein [Shimia aestuarii]|uniref:Uncharacterized protein n=1 Tax=Shimia aestuarii TaxID=254406 RepID=A0A1I4J918_9RHOB|nr:hypothetical protein [Shimia aestuarii]SFL63075.1 hypothetical protein SAMN04488042_101925 [Shimia aestuarii]
MVIRKSTRKLDDYIARIGQPDAPRVKPSHVAKVLAKLEKKEADLLEEIAETKKAERQDRLQSKLEVVREQIRRGTILFNELSPPDPDQGAK